MTSTFTITTLAGSILVELPLDDAALDLVVGDLVQLLPPMDGAGVPRLLLGPRELGWSERLADLALAPGTVLTRVLVNDPEKASADLMGTNTTSIRLAAARALRAMGAAAAGQAEELANAVLSDPDAEVMGEAREALREVDRGSVSWFACMAELAQDLEDPSKLVLQTPIRTSGLESRLLALLAQCAVSPEQAALRGRTVLRRLAPLDPEAARRDARCYGELLPADPLDDPRPEVRLAAVAVLASDLTNGRATGPQVQDAAGKLQSVLQGDVCLGVRRRAAAALRRLSQRAPVLQFLAGARAALAAEAKALRRSPLPTDRCRMKAVQSIKQLLG